MLNSFDLVKKLEKEAVADLTSMLVQVPALNQEDIQVEPRHVPDGAVDFLVTVQYNGKTYVIVADIKATAPPRKVRSSILDLQKATRYYGQDAVPLIVAPYLSPEARAICREYEIGYLDLEGNCRLSFGSVFIDRSVQSKPVAQRREFKSLFSPKSARVLSVMMRDPSRPWKVQALSAEAHVSVGHVSNVRTALLEREWAKIEEDGFSLLAPDGILDAWRDAYSPPQGRQYRFYTTLHGSSLEKKIREMFARIPFATTFTNGVVMLASFSAAKWISPYARTGSEYFYANDTGLALLKEELKLTPTTKGENVLITLLEDENLPVNFEHPAIDIICTDPVQTYLDLWASGERGREAAEHLRNEKLIWKK
ncbi:MAG: hypothetical protein A3J24_06020 [Deltaproteobacteria bacterium RIFCSPLOWO2_02_FULL_53_8]|nr:MAG: hypothetical protein A3J24_06020 [Deltaproteobacteria bacterium RIFCSPLOWO2_02_FULL_53_8]